MTFAAIITAIRPKTLTAALVPVAVGTAIASTVRWDLAAFALSSALLIQIATNLLNDALDFKKGADAAQRLGPVRATQSGLLSYGQVMGLGVSCLLVALILGVPLVLAGGWPLVAIGLLSLFFAYGYTGGPFPLAYLGLGDLFVLVFFGWVAVGGVYFLHVGTLDARAIVAGTQIGLLATVLIAINNLRDHAGDVRVGKKTLAVRLGVKGSRIEISLLCLLPFGLGGYWLFNDLRWGAVLPLFSLPLTVKILRGIWKSDPGPTYNQYLAQAAGLHLLFGLLLCVGARLP